MQIITIILYAVISVTGLSLVKLGSHHPLSFAVGADGFSVGAGWMTLLGLALYVISFFDLYDAGGKKQLNLSDTGFVCCGLYSDNTGFVGAVPGNNDTDAVGWLEFYPGRRIFDESS